MEKSLQQLTAESLINNYPLDVLEYIVEAGKKKINKKVKMTEVLWFNMDELMKMFNDEKIESYLFVAQFCLDMKIDQYAVLYDDNEYINRKINDLIKQINGLDRIEISDEFDTILGAYQSIFERSTRPKIMYLLNQYSQYMSYYKIIDCHKYDYIILYQHKFGTEYTYDIRTDLSEIDIGNDSGLIKLAVYQVR